MGLHYYLHPEYVSGMKYITKAYNMETEKIRQVRIMHSVDALIEQYEHAKNSELYLQAGVKEPLPELPKGIYEFRDKMKKLVHGTV